MTEEANILACEQRRIAALLASDYAMLGQLLADDLVHIHANGSVDGKAKFLATIEEQLEFVEMVRGDQLVRVHGDTAISTGPLKQTVRVKGPGTIVAVNIVTTQVWRRDGGSWRLCSFHATRPAEH